MSSLTERPWLSRDATSMRRADVAWAVVVAFVVFIVFIPALNCDFVYFDDQTFVVKNPHVNNGLTWDAVRWAFEIHGPSLYHPLTWLSHALDCELFGLDPRGHHFTNVLLHALSAGLVVVWLRMMSSSTVPSVIAAAVFALHPLRVESVVWVAERKDVLSVFFAVLTLVLYTWHAKRPGGLRFGSVAFVFALCLLAKPMLVTLPLVMLMLDIWPLRRMPMVSWSRLVLEKLALMAMSAIAGVLTVLTQHEGGAIENTAVSPPQARLANAVVAGGWYLWKTLWPSDLAVFYPFRADWPPWLVLFSGVVLVGVSLAVARYWRTMPWLAVGWVWCVVTVLPAIGIIQVGSQGMADRYSYFPSLGLSFALAWMSVCVFERHPRLVRPLLVTACVGIVSLIACTIRQTSYWTNSVTLFTRALEVTPPNALVHQNLGMALAEAGRDHEALLHLQKSVEMKGDFARARVNLGGVLLRLGRVQDAVTQLEAALVIDSKRTEAHLSLGTAMSQLGRWHSAIDHFKRFLDAHPNDALTPSALNDLAVAESHIGEWDSAERHWRRAIELSPDYLSAYYNLGTRLRARGDLAGAMRCFKRVVELRPDMATAHNTLGTLLASQGRLHEAAESFRRAVELEPDFVDAKANLARAAAMLKPSSPPSSP